MSEFSQPLSTCSRTTDFSFCFNNSAFSDAVLVLLTLRPKSASIPWRLASSVAQLFVSAVEVSATTLTSTVPVSDTWAAAGKALGSLGQTVVSRLSPQEGTEVSISRVYQVNSALLAASSPYLRSIIQQPPQLQHLVPGLTSVASRHRPRKLVAVLVQPHHVAAAEAVVKFIFTNDIALTSAQQALDALLVAEQLQVPDCAEVCQHYLEDCSMDWPVALTLVHLQHKHQQEQQHQHHQHQQQQQQQLQQAPGSLPRNSSSGSSVASARRQGPVGRSSLHGRSSKGAGLLRGLGASGANALEAVAPLLPVPHDSVYLQGLLLRAQDFLVHQFEDLELVMASPEGRQRLLLLPYDALRAILGHPSLKLASENTALAAAAGWLHANAAQVSSLLLSSGSSSSIGAVGLGAAHGGKEAPGGDVCAQSVYSSALYNSSSSNGVAGHTEGSNAAGGVAAGGIGTTTNKAGLTVAQNGTVQPALTPTQAQQQQQQAPVAASGTISLLLDLCQVLRLCQCSYTYVLHVLPHLPLFKEEPGLVGSLQFEVMRFRAASSLRRKRLAAEAAAAAAAAASTAGLSGHHLAGLDHHHSQQQQQQQGVQAPAGGSDSSGEPGRAGPGKEGGCGDRHTAAAAAAAAGAAPCLGWRSGAPVDAALLQCQARPESVMTSLDFTFTFDPQDMAEQSNGGQGGSSGGAVGGSSGGSSSGSSGVDLMARLLGLTPQQQSDTPTVISDDHYFAGYVWNLVAAADGFVGVSWRVLLPGGVDVPVAAPHLGQQQQQQQVQGQPPAAVAARGASEAWSSSRQQCIGSWQLFGPDCAGFRSPEVAVTFSITGSSLSRVQRNSSSSGSLAAAAAGSSGGGVAPSVGAAAAGMGAAGAAAATPVLKPGSKADQAGSISPGGPSISRAVQQQQVAQGSPNKGSKVLGRAYSEVQFVPAHCAWGFPDFSPAGWEGLKGPDGKVCLRCQLKHRE